MSRKMLQTTTELSELCERLAGELSLTPQSIDGGTELRGNTYSITRGIEEDGSEIITYRDQIGWVSADGHRRVVYCVKGRYFDGRADVLKQTDLGIQILARLKANMVAAKEAGCSEESARQSEFTGQTSYHSTEQIRELIKSHIFDSTNP